MLELKDVVGIVTGVILSIGGGGAIVLGLSAWLGKIWANRLMTADRAKHESELEQTRSQFKHSNDLRLNEIKNELDIYKEKHLKGHADKIAIYRLVADVIVDILGDLDLVTITGATPEDAKARWDRFNRGRMKAYGYLAMLAPQSVMDAIDELMDHLIEITHGKTPYVWPDVRKRVLGLLNEIRKDIGIDESPIEYRGRL